MLTSMNEWSGARVRGWDTDLQQRAMDVVLLAFGSRFWREILQEGLDGGRDLGHEHERDQGTSCHLPGPVHRRTATPGVSQETLV